MNYVNIIAFGYKHYLWNQIHPNVQYVIHICINAIVNIFVRLTVSSWIVQTLFGNDYIV